ncbi:MAG: beta-aspartyl-peptidase, partial [Flavobacteriaceae bacterium]|nr:beta-aspartyl-peptidase [Flavobacteriaceae bacterium]
MKKAIFLFTILLLLANCKQAEKDSGQVATETNGKAEFSIVIHGGAGTILKKNMTPEKEAAYKAILEEAIRVGYEILKNGGTSLDAVTKTINVMEDSPLFNAGKGAVFTNAGTNELDASIMDGKTLNAGASAGTTNVKYP